MEEIIISLLTLVIVTVSMLVSCNNVEYQGISATSSDYNNLTGRINSMLTPVSSSLGIMEGEMMMMTPSMKNNSTTLNMTVSDDQTRMKAMKFSMAQDVTWLLSGNWNLLLNNNNGVTSVTTANYSNSKGIFDAEFTKITTNGTMKHSHRISNFAGSSYSSPDLQMKKISGNADVYFNNELAWPNSTMSVTLLNDEVLRIDIDSADIDNHFHGQPIYGLVTSS
jgi:major membrane immunogen (membrane-anchored lipoprotein)